MRFCAFFAPDQIPEEIFIKGAPEPGENLGALAAKTLQRTQIIGQACRFSILQRDTISKKLSIHRQVQAVLRDMMAEKGEEGRGDLLGKLRIPVKKHGPTGGSRAS